MPTANNRFRFRLWAVTNGEEVRTVTTNETEARARATVINRYLSRDDIPFTVEAAEGVAVIPGVRSVRRSEPSSR